MSSSDVPSTLPRIGYSLGVAVGMWLLYSAVTLSIQISSGISYLDWFATADNAWRTAVIPLLIGAVVLGAFTLWSRWSHLWREPVRLHTTTTMKIAMALWIVAIVARLVGVRWADVPTDLLVAILLTGVLVGFAEEVLFRGIVLRSLRHGGRSEASAAIWTGVWFGLFHAPNMWMGTGWIGGLQIVLAALMGIVLYVFRRHFGLLWPAMLAHGAWDISVFLGERYSRTGWDIALLSMQLTVMAAAVAVYVSLVRQDRRTVVLPAAERGFSGV
ncbi:MAG: CAAX amino terminal protease self- immunity [Alphaproteobacteria bacterium ADurb.BinA280]|jgi:membrane protease YdiL (CAAX protease family)|nr:CPBP family intramembrane metalloprotease [Aquimonas sp.]OPZ13874.1 MAG: CAAX amino terminal protease self- immunity [Alphaproteobacteria bacterium ADurb.BinA280]